MKISISVFCDIFGFWGKRFCPLYRGFIIPCTWFSISTIRTFCVVVNNDSFAPDIAVGKRMCWTLTVRKELDLGVAAREFLVFAGLFICAAVNCWKKHKNYKIHVCNTASFRLLCPTHIFLRYKLYPFFHTQDNMCPKFGWDVKA